jgi:hypothetical protein
MGDLLQHETLERSDGLSFCFPGLPLSLGNRAQLLAKGIQEGLPLSLGNRAQLLFSRAAALARE